jgi:hypothetical protein
VRFSGIRTTKYDPHLLHTTYYWSITESSGQSSDTGVSVHKRGWFIGHLGKRWIVSAASPPPPDP